MNIVVRVGAMLMLSVQVDALRIAITPADVDRALTVARSREADRERFHSAYIQAVNTPFIERVEVVSELRLVDVTYTR